MPLSYVGAKPADVAVIAIGSNQVFARYHSRDDLIESYRRQETLTGEVAPARRAAAAGGAAADVRPGRAGDVVREARARQGDDQALRPPLHARRHCLFTAYDKTPIVPTSSSRATR